MPEPSLGRPDLEPGYKFKLDMTEVHRELYLVDQALGTACHHLRNGYVYNGIDNNLAADVLELARQLVARTKHRLIEG